MKFAKFITQVLNFGVVDCWDLGKSGWYSQVRSQNRQNDDFGGVGEKKKFRGKKLIILFFGVKFTEDYYDITIIPYLFRDHSEKSKNR